MARIFKIYSEYSRFQSHTGWIRLLRYFTRKPAWKRVSKYDSVLRDALKARMIREKSPTGTTGWIYKGATSSRSRTSSTARLPTHTSARHKSGRMGALVHQLMSDTFMAEVNFLVRSRVILYEQRQRRSKLEAEILDLRAQANQIAQSLKDAEEQGDQELLMVHDEKAQHVVELRAKASAIVRRRNAINEDCGHAHGVFVIACDDMAATVGPLLEQAGLLPEMDKDTIRARMCAPMPDNNIYEKKKSKKADAGAQTTSDKETGPTAEQRVKDELRETRRTAFLDYEKAQADMESHRYTYTQQVDKHRNGISPGWGGWDPSWSDEVFDTQHLRQAMLYSSKIRETEDELYKAMEDAHDGGVSPMPHFQITGFQDRPDDDPADSVRGVDRDRINEWGARLPSLPPDPEPYGPGVVQYPSDQMSDLDRHVEMWETWSFREEDVQKKRLIDMHQRERPTSGSVALRSGAQDEE